MNFDRLGSAATKSSSTLEWGPTLGAHFWYSDHEEQIAKNPINLPELVNKAENKYAGRGTSVEVRFLLISNNEM